MAFDGAAAPAKRQPCGTEPDSKPEAKPKGDIPAAVGEKGKPEADRQQQPDHEAKAPHRHEADQHKHDKATSADDGARLKPAWVSAAGRLLHGTKASSSWCKGHGPLFKTKKGACSRCECLPCPECVHAFQNIRDTLLSMLTKYHGDVDAGTLMNYSLMFTGLKKNGDVKVDVHHRCCAKHKQRFISSLTINTCCRKHKVETCERIVQTLRDNARSSRPNEARHSPGEVIGDDFGHDMDELETDDMEEEEEDEEEEDEEHGDLEEEESSAPSSDDSHHPHAGDAQPQDGGRPVRGPHAPGTPQGAPRDKLRGKR